jgi:hypothetical protein
MHIFWILVPKQTNLNEHKDFSRMNTSPLWSLTTLNGQGKDSVTEIKISLEFFNIFVLVVKGSHVETMYAIYGIVWAFNVLLILIWANKLQVTTDLDIILTLLGT